MTDIRKEFEAWAEKDYEYLLYGGLIPHTDSKLAWQAYQAAAESRDAKLATLESELVAMTAELKAARKANDDLQQSLRGEG